MSDPSSQYLELLERAYRKPEQRPKLRSKIGLGAPGTPWDVKERLIASFLDTTIQTEGIAARPELHALLVALGWRPAMMEADIQRALGIDVRRDAVLAAIVDAFRVFPLEGCVIRQAYLEDERGFRVVPAAEVERARAAAVTTSWRDVPDSEIDFAFEKNSVYIWLDQGAIDFYLPACLSYALRELGQCEFYTLLHFAEMPFAAARAAYPPAQLRAIAMFIAFILEENPSRSLIEDNRANLDAWLASLNG